MNSRSGYATYDGYPRLAFNIITYLLTSESDDAEMIWKLLKYNTPTAFAEANLTMDEKTELIYDGSPDSTEFRVFMDQGTEDGISTEMTLLRIYPLAILPTNYVTGVCGINFEVYSHFKTNMMKNRQTKIDTIIHALIKTLNGVDIESLGNLSFGSDRSRFDKVVALGVSPYKGKCLTMSTNIC